MLPVATQIHQFCYFIARLRTFSIPSSKLVHVGTTTIYFVTVCCVKSFATVKLYLQHNRTDRWCLFAFLLVEQIHSYALK